MKLIIRFFLFVALITQIGRATDQSDQARRVRSCVYTYPNLNLLYYVIWKNGSSTMREILPGKRVQKGFDKISDKEFENSTKLLIVRDPYSRAVSSYLQVLKLGDKFNGTPITPKTKFFALRKQVRLSFKEFLYFIKNGNFYDWHVEPQSMIFYQKEKKLSEMDFIADVDHLNADLRKFSKLIGVPLNTSLKLNPALHAGAKRELMTYIQTDAEIRQLIEEVYAEDFIFYKKAMERREEILASLD